MKHKVKITGAPAWHVHHSTLMEWCYSFKERRKVIKHGKPWGEQKDRLRLLRKVHPVPGWITQIIREAHSAARSVCRTIENRFAYNARYRDVFMDHFNYLVRINQNKARKLHAAQCGPKRRCVWSHVFGFMRFPK